MLKILGWYRCIYEDLMAVPVIPGWKSEKEKFDGADATSTVEVPRLTCSSYLFHMHVHSPPPPSPPYTLARGLILMRTVHPLAGHAECHSQQSKAVSDRCDC